MKRPTIDYSGFRLSRINEPQFAHAKLLLGWVGYFALYFLTENLIPAEKCTPIHCFLDDLIPFNEFFVIFYVGWYLLVVGSLAYTFFYNVDSFRKLQTYIIITQVVAMAAYILFPSRQDLRPDEFVRNNVLTQIISFIYAFDTSTGVCPSLHVAYSMGILSVLLRDKTVTRPWKVFLVADVLGVCLSVCFVKQHSIVDVFAALPVCLLAEFLVFGKIYRRGKQDAEVS